jgi:uncharacterized membrane protein SpoIIM required for sporulation/uncharacterized RDD family membrane protein YckC
MVAQTAPEPDAALQRVARLLTPERVPLTLPLAGLGERALAYGIDLAIILASALAGLFIYNLRGDIEADLVSLSGVGRLLLLVGALVALGAYDVLFEVFGDGRTPGKRLMRLRVLGADGHAPDALRSIVRNALRLLDAAPFLYGVGTVTLFVTGTRRLGDLLADTVVVSERMRRADPLALCREVAGPLEAGARAPTWGDADAVFALEMLVRSADLPAAAADKLCARALARVGEPAAEAGESRRTLARGCALLADARAGALAQIGRMTEAQRRLDEALQRLRAAPALDTAEEADEAIRHAGSELMRATRRRVSARQLEALSLALLDAERRRGVRLSPRRGLLAFLARDVPAAIFEERRLIARAAGVFCSALVIGFALCVADGPLGRALIGETYATAIERGANWMDNIAAERMFALAAVRIILNNAWVCVIAFVSGLLGGVFPLVVLFANGLHLGCFFGYATRVGTAENLLRFVLAHGPVELTAVCVAGAAGLCLGRALLSPGRRTRLEALRAEAATGARMLLGALFAILVIGTVEGFVSPGAFLPWPLSLALGVGLWLLFFAWVRSLGGAEWRSRQARAAEALA